MATLNRVCERGVASMCVVNDICSHRSAQESRILMRRSRHVPPAAAEACVYKPFCDSPSPPPSPPAPPLPPTALLYSAPPGVTAAYALSLAATGMMCFIFFFVAKQPYGPPPCDAFVIVAFCSPFVLALPLALQLGMPEWIFDIDVVICIAGAGIGLLGFFGIFCCQSSHREDSFIIGSASLALLVTALNALIPAAAVYTVLPLVWAVGSGFAISGWLACEKERVASSCERFFGLALTVVRSMVTLPLAVLPWVEAMPGGLFDAPWFACAAMALVHLSMAFWLSDGKPHIVVAWVSSAVMGLALLQGVATVAPPAVWEKMVVVVLLLLLLLLYLYQRWSQATTHQQIPPAYQIPPSQQLPAPISQQLPPPISQPLPAPISQQLPAPISQQLPTPISQPLSTPISTWQCQVDGGAFVDFSAAILITLEMQYTSYWNGGSPTTTFIRDGIPYKADFRTMEQQRDDGLYDTKRAIRRQELRPPLQHSSSVLALAQHMNPPGTWSAMKNQAVAELFPLPPGPELYQVRQAFMKTLNSSIKNVNVQRIQNVSLWRQYATKRWEFVSRECESTREGPSSQARCERVWLFHGTDEDTVKKIVQRGFNRSFAGKNATVYGKGVYFARDASCNAAHRTFPIERSPFATCHATLRVRSRALQTRPHISTPRKIIKMCNICSSAGWWQASSASVSRMLLFHGRASETSSSIQRSTM
jgi:hypothetical protein